MFLLLSEAVLFTIRKKTLGAFCTHIEALASIIVIPTSWVYDSSSSIVN